jgi:hypothetical protein
MRLKFCLASRGKYMQLVLVLRKILIYVLKKEEATGDD